MRRALRRLGWSLFVVWAVVTLAFAVNNLVPGDAARMVAGVQALANVVAGQYACHHVASAEAEGQAKNANELAALTKRGMPPLEAIRAATMNAAELMGWEDKVGALEPGHYADVIAVEADPLTDITQLQHVQWVMKGGIVIKDAPPSAH